MKQLVYTMFGNRIIYATTNGRGLITGKKHDITDDAVLCVFRKMMDLKAKGEEITYQLDDGTKMAMRVVEIEEEKEEYHQNCGQKLDWEE